jgi:membrane protease YdiL (CAAX protease family)
LPFLLVTAAIFTAHHVLVLRAFFPWPFVLWGSAGVFVAGLVWTWLYARMGTVWPSYVSHMLADCALLWVGYSLLFP